MFDIYRICFFFIIYAVMGWCLEVIYEAVDQGVFINRGFLNGPYCPIYGFGVIIVIQCLTPIKNNILVLYVGSVILTSLLEFITGFILEKIFHQKWWDYTAEHFNIKGYICLKFSLLWGIACLVVIRIIHPLIERFVNWIPHFIGNIILIVALLGLLSDIIITILSIMHIKKRLRLIEIISQEMRKISDHSGEKIYGAVKGISDKNEARKAKIEDLKAKYKKDFHKKNMGGKRIEKAFPRLKIHSGRTLKDILDEYKNK